MEQSANIIQHPTVTTIHSTNITHAKAIEHLRAAYPDRLVLTTAEVAKAFCVRPETVQRANCMQGEYLGLRPTKLANRRLLWSLA